LFTKITKLWFSDLQKVPKAYPKKRLVYETLNHNNSSMTGFFVTNEHFMLTLYEFVMIECYKNYGCFLKVAKKWSVYETLNNGESSRFLQK
jgi:hypothetical protein